MVMAVILVAWSFVEQANPSPPLHVEEPVDSDED